VHEIEMIVVTRILVVT